MASLRLNSDHLHEPLDRLDPERLPPNPEDTQVVQDFMETCRCGLIRILQEEGTPAGPWFLRPKQANPNGGKRPGPQEH